ncbi:phage tail tape measure protein [Ralstonia solanacearum]|uniref:Phage tail tape measure protein n=1 Tax=Ralstonia solanacearum TaxID=305 RepID=A0AAW5ZP50_RALSL|nr:phage tail tape measure protein [Ralstonia solanacearum]MDB0572245.1 phage tail tape measure protein [Ralstonia solanacearum]
MSGLGSIVFKMSLDAADVPLTAAEVENRLSGVGKAAKTAAADANATMSQMSAGARQMSASFKALDTSPARRFVDGLKEQAATVGKSQEEVLAYRAAQLGVSKEAEPFIKRISEAKAGMHGLNFETTGARRELMVLAHEASQGSWKNFGGSLLVLAEQTDALAAVFSPAGLAVGALVGGLGLFAAAAIKGHHESEALRNSLVLTGNAAGMNTDRFDVMARQMSNDMGRSIGATREALQELVSTGGFAGKSLQLLGEDAVRMAELTGGGLDEIVKDLARMPEGVAKWAEEHNRSMHFITLAQYDYIRTLEEQGKREEAEIEVAKALYDHLGVKAPQNLGFLSSAWRELKRVVTDTWDAMKAVGRETPLSVQIAKLSERKMAAKNPSLGDAAMGTVPTWTAQDEEQLRNLNQQLLKSEDQATRAAEGARQQQAAIAGRGHIERIRLETDEQAKLNKELKAYRVAVEAVRAVNPNDPSVSAAAVAKDEADIRKKYNKKGGGADGENALSGRLAALEEQTKAREKDYKGEVATLEQLRAQDFMSEVEFLQRKFDARRAALQDELKIAQQQAEVAGGKKALAERARYAGRVKEIQQDIANTAKEEAAAVAKAQRAVEEVLLGTRLKMANFASGRDRQVARELDTISMGDRARDWSATQNRTEDEFRRFRDEYTNEMRKKGALGSEDYLRGIQEIDDAQRAQMERERGYFDQRMAMQADWTNGARRALENYGDNAANVAGSTESAFTRLFDSMESGVASFAASGKLDFKGFAQSVIADLARIQARAAISGLAQMGISLLGSMFGAAAGGAAGPVQGSVDAGTAGVSFTTPVDISTPAAAVPLHHSGGMVGSEPTAFRVLPMAAFDRAPKYHTGGIAADEVPALLKRGEGVFTPGQMRNLAPVSQLAGSQPISISIAVSVTPSGVTEERQQGAAAADGQQLAVAIKGAVVVELQNQLRQGGLLWNFGKGRS